jgi:hypothetical protein
MKAVEFLTFVREHSDCLVRPPVGMPITGNIKHQLPDDLTEFYSFCGGVELFRSAEYPYSILSPNRFLPANEILVPDLWSEPEWLEDISSDWYLIASDPEKQYLTIDLNVLRLGRCYDSFIGRHGIRGFCPIIARSFSELLQNLWFNQGHYPYWLMESFSLGDAYDGM